MLNRLFARILVNTSDGRRARFLTSDLRLLDRDSDFSDEPPEQAPEAPNAQSLSDCSDSGEEGGEQHLAGSEPRLRRQRGHQDWLSDLRRQPRRPHVMRRLVHDFLVRASLRDAAEAFAEEAGLEEGEAPETKVSRLVGRVSELLDRNQTAEVLRLLDGVSPQIASADLRFELKVFSIRKRDFANFAALCESLRRDLLPFLEQPGVACEHSPESPAKSRVRRSEACDAAPTRGSADQKCLEPALEPEQSSHCAKVLRQIEELSAEFALGSLSDSEAVRRQKETLVRRISQKMLVHHNVDPKSRLEQLLKLNQGLQRVLGASVDFPHIKKGVFCKDRTFFKEAEPLELK